MGPSVLQTSCGGKTSSWGCGCLFMVGDWATQEDTSCLLCFYHLSSAGDGVAERGDVAGGDGS